MTQKMKLFCEYYLTCFNATQAAKKAGYSSKTAYAIGEENLKKPEIKAYIEERIKAKEDNIIATQDEVLATITEIMRSKRTLDVNKLKASELLCRVFKLFEDQKEIKANVTIINDIPK